MLLNWKCLLETKIKNNDDQFYFDNYFNRQQEHLVTQFRLIELVAQYAFES